LKLQGLVAEDAHSPSGFGYLLFGKDPRLAMPQAGLLARAELPNGKAERKEFSMPMVLIPGELEKWLNKILPNTLERSKMERTERVDLPFEMIREAVVNALIHRDYDIKGQKCQLVVTSDAITIKSPGDPIPPITMEQMRSFKAPMKSRNPVLHFVFARMGLAEEQGYGLSGLKEQAEKHDLPLPTYVMEGGSLVLTIYRSKTAILDELASKVPDGLGSDEKAVLELISKQQLVSSRSVQDQLGFDERKAQRILKKLREADLIRRQGRGPSTVYSLVQS
jgi:ATP-dependent DNA helicase RecG